MRIPMPNSTHGIIWLTMVNAQDYTFVLIRYMRTLNVKYQPHRKLITGKAVSQFTRWIDYDEQSVKLQQTSTQTKTLLETNWEKFSSTLLWWLWLVFFFLTLLELWGGCWSSSILGSWSWGKNVGDEPVDPCSIAAMQIYWCEVGKTGTNLTIAQL